MLSVETPILLALGAFAAAWTVLSLLGGERQRKVAQAEAERAERVAAAAESDAPPPPPPMKKPYVPRQMNR